MVNFYPDILSYWIETAATRNAEGFYTEGSGEWGMICACRIEYAAPGSKVSGNDKAGVSHYATVYAPLSLPSLPDKGQKIKVTKTDQTTHEGTVINAERGLLHVRIWID